MLVNYLLIILIKVLIVNKVFASLFCGSSQDIFQAYNIGKNVFLGQGTLAIWNFNTDVNQLIDQKLEINEIFGEKTFEWVDTAFSLNFRKCDSNSMENYCEAIEKARNTVIAIGQRVGYKESDKYGYISYRIKPNNYLERFNETDIIWNLNDTGRLTNDFWVSLPGDLLYSSSVFIAQRNELIVSVYSISSITDSHYHLMSRKLEDNGEWSDKWTEISNTGFSGMFQINTKVYGINKKNIVYEFKWNNDSITFDKISTIKELINCYSNSTLMGLPADEPKTNDNKTEPSIKQIHPYLDPFDEEINSDNNPESTESKNNSLILIIISIVVLVALTAIIIFIIIFCLRKKSKSQTIYLDTMSTSDKVKTEESVKTIGSKHI